MKLDIYLIKEGDGMQSIDLVNEYIKSNCNAHNFFCAERILSCVASNQNVEYEFIFYKSWNFSFSDNKDKTIGNKIVVDYGDLYDYFYKFYGIERKVYPNSQDETFWNLCINELLHNRVFAININYIWDCPLPFMKRNRGGLLVTGYDIHNGIIAYDSQMNGEKRLITKDMFLDNCIESNIFVKNHDIDIKACEIIFRKHLTSIKERIFDDLTALYHMAEEFYYTFDLESETNIFFNCYYSSFVYNLFYIIRSRMVFASFINAFMRQTHKDLSILIKYFSEISLKWNRIHLLIQKAQFKKTIHKEKIYILMLDAIDLEKELCKYFTTINWMENHR
jgi:hypothetical protein